MMNILRWTLILLLPFSVSAQQRQQLTINSNWQFVKDNVEDHAGNVAWESVTIPHSWNADDVMDDVPGYYRDTACYKKTIYVPSSWKDKEVYLLFDAVGISASVFVNGKLAGEHKGAYTSFNVPIRDFLRFAEKGNCKNEIFVRANNTYTDDIPPLGADFTFFGGIYRDVHLLALDKVHFRMDELNSNGIFWKTPHVSSEVADLVLEGAFSNHNKQKKSVLLEHLITDSKGLTIQEYKQNYAVEPGSSVDLKCELKVNHPRLWSPEHPHLYRIISRLKVEGEIVDEIENPLAFRWFEFDAEKGFSLNGSPYKLIGTSRHQDYPGLGNALDDGIHLQDVKLLKEMGGNFLRISHYPQDKTVIEACDRLGILTSIEIPLVNRITESDAFFRNSETMLREMMAQYFNHPSLIIWAYMNEILLRPPYKKGTEEWKRYLKSNYELFSGLERIVRETDPYRYTMMVGHGGGSAYKEAGLIHIPKLFGWNIYTGWYSGRSNQIGASMDRMHALCGDVPILLTEYGADADIRIHSFSPVRFDKSVEYALDYHREYLKAFKERNFINGMVVWNLADFSSESRTETTPHVNAKGLLTNERQVKDTYRFYQANLLKEAYLRIGSKEWNFRTAEASENGDEYVEQTVPVFSNSDLVELLHNGISLGKINVKNGMAMFTVPFRQGKNQLLAKAITQTGELYDEALIDFDIIPLSLNKDDSDFSEINVSLGDKRFYTDYKRHVNWLPAKPYMKGSWGYVGGEMYKMASTKRQQYGSDKNILDTDLDAIYATQQVGIEQFRFDVPDGKYTLTLHFAELHSAVEHQALAYNLDDGTHHSNFLPERVFRVFLNEDVLIHQLSNKEDLVPEKAIAFKTTVVVNDGQGIVFKFVPIEGKTILNGIQLLKVY